MLVAIALAVAAATTAIAIFVDWLPDQASEERQGIDFVLWLTIAICIGVFAIVAAISIYAGLKFRVRPDDDSDGPPIHGHTGIEILWTAVPAVIVTAIGIVSAVVLARNADAGDRALEVQAIGQQFTWKFAYPEFEDPDTNEPVTTGQLVLPVGRPAHFTMTAVDVLHSFWVPNFGQKMDAVPGIETEIVVTPKRTGDFAVVCAELCGLGHATMRAKAQVVSEQEFQAWIEEQRS
jgi:cytochrome c oxidase subunit II